MKPLKYFKTETDFRKWLIPKVRKCNAQVFSIVGSKMQQGGWPDVIIEHMLYHGYVEFKNEKTVLRADQKEQITKLIATGANAVIVRAPNRIEDQYGNLLGLFNQTGIGLLLELQAVVEGQINVETSLK